jgi:hypothetical protein
VKLILKPHLINARLGDIGFAQPEGKTMKARMFPSYTLADLRRFLAKSDLEPETRAQIETEISARESGKSRVQITPQIGRPRNC